MSDGAPPVPPGGTIPLALGFRYTHGLGDLAPHLAGLERGEAWASRCAGCGAVWFAPRRVCRCGGREMGWLRLPGTGTVLASTEGELPIPLTARRILCAVALIRMDGATNAVLGRLAEGAKARPGQRLRLAVDPAPRAHPVQAALFLPLSE